MPRADVGAETDLPAITGDARGDEREGELVELNEAVAVGVGGEEEFAGEGGACARGLPDGLALLNAPAG